MTSEHAATVFAALGEPTRCEIVSQLTARGVATQRVLAERFDITRQAIAKHLLILERAAIIRSERIGRERRYSLDGAALVAAQTWIRDRHTEWDQRLSRLDDLLRSESPD